MLARIIKWFKTYLQIHRIEQLRYKLNKLGPVGPHERLALLCQELQKLPHTQITPTLAGMEMLSVIDLDLDTLTILLRQVNLQLQADQQLAAVFVSHEVTRRSLESLFVSNKNYVPFSRITTFLEESEKLAKLTGPLKGAEFGKQEHNFRITTNLVRSCEVITLALLGNLEQGYYGL